MRQERPCAPHLSLLHATFRWRLTLVFPSQQGEPSPFGKTTYQPRQPSVSEPRAALAESPGVFPEPMAASRESTSEADKGFEGSAEPER